MGCIFLRWQKWAAGAGRHHEIIGVQTCAKQGLLPWARATFQNNFVLPQDNGLPTTARATRDFLEKQDVEVMDWWS